MKDPNTFSQGLKISMALRYDHSFGMQNGIEQRKTIDDAIQAYLRGDGQVTEEVEGEGFYSPSREQDYIALMRPNNVEGYYEMWDNLIKAKNK